MEPPIPLTKPWLGAEEREAVLRPLASGWPMQGPEVAAFEAELAAFVGARHACVVSSGTAALELALAAVGVGPGDEVVTVSHSFVATANAVRLVGAVPVFVDIEPASLNMDPRGLAGATTGRTRAILVVHQLGLPADLGAIVGFARARGLPVVEDAACAMGSEIDLGEGLGFQRIGRPHGDVATFSFHPRKLLTTGDGGMIATASAEWDAGFRRGRNHGAMGQELGRNFRMTDLQAAVGRAQLVRLPVLLGRRREQVARYRERLVGRVGFPSPPEWTRPNWQSLCVRLPDPRKVAAALEERGIASRPGIACAHRLPVYRQEPFRAPGGLVESERAEEEGLMLPLFHELGDGEIDRVADAVIAAL